MTVDGSVFFVVWYVFAIYKVDLFVLLNLLDQGSFRFDIVDSPLFCLIVVCYLPVVSEALAIERRVIVVVLLIAPCYFSILISLRFELRLSLLIITVVFLWSRCGRWRSCQHGVPVLLSRHIQI